MAAKYVVYVKKDLTYTCISCTILLYIAQVYSKYT